MKQSKYPSKYPAFWDWSGFPEIESRLSRLPVPPLPVYVLDVTFDAEPVPGDPVDPADLPGGQTEGCGC